MNCNMLSQENISNTPINKGFSLIHEFLMKNNCVCIKNEMDCISYSKSGYETDTFELRVDKSRVYVSIPVKNSPYQYCTSFKDYFQACEYMEERFLDFYE